MGGADGAGQAVLGHLGEFGGLGLGQLQIGRHHADRGVADRLGGLRCRERKGAGAGQGPEFVADAQIGPEQFAGIRVDDTTEGIDGDDSADDDALAQIVTGGPQAALEAAGDGARTRADVTQGEDAGGQILARPAAEVRRGSVPECPAKAAGVEEDRRRDDGHDLTVAQGPAQTTILQPGHDAIRRGQAEGAAAREDDGVDPIHQVDRIQEVGFPGARGGAAHIDTAHRAATGEDDRRPGVVGGVMADLDAGDVGDEVVGTGLGCLRVGVSHGLKRLNG